MRSTKKEKKKPKNREVENQRKLKKINSKLQTNAFVCFVKYHMNSLMIFCSGIARLV